MEGKNAQSLAFPVPKAVGLQPDLSLSALTKSQTGEINGSRAGERYVRRFAWLDIIIGGRQRVHFGHLFDSRLHTNKPKLNKK